MEIGIADNQKLIKDEKKCCGCKRKVVENIECIKCFSDYHKTCFAKSKGTQLTLNKGLCCLSSETDLLQLLTKLALENEMYMRENNTLKRLNNKLEEMNELLKEKISTPTYAAVSSTQQ